MTSTYNFIYLFDDVSHFLVFIFLKYLPNDFFQEVCNTGKSVDNFFFHFEGKMKKVLYTK